MTTPGQRLNFGETDLETAVQCGAQLPSELGIDTSYGQRQNLHPFLHAEETDRVPDDHCEGEVGRVAARVPDDQRGGVDPSLYEEDMALYQCHKSEAGHDLESLEHQTRGFLQDHKNWPDGPPSNPQETVVNILVQVGDRWHALWWYRQKLRSTCPDLSRQEAKFIRKSVGRHHGMGRSAERIQLKSCLEGLQLCADCSGDVPHLTLKLCSELDQNIVWQFEEHTCDGHYSSYKKYVTFSHNNVCYFWAAGKDGQIIAVKERPGPKLSLFQFV